MGQAWEGVPTATKQATMNTLHKRGQIAMISFGGSTETPYNNDPTAFGKLVANWAIDNLLDGVDFDLENFGQGFTAPGLNSDKTVAWVSTITNAARAVLGNNRYVTHAPQAPYFGAIGNKISWAGTTGGYTGVYLQTVRKMRFSKK
jgi:chitinase